MKIFPITVAIMALALLVADDCHAFKCNITTTPVNFALYDVLNSNANESTGTINVDCSNPVGKPITVTVTLSAGSSGSFLERTMKLTTGSDSLIYNLYTNSARDRVMGDGSGTTEAPTNVVTRPQAWTISLYGRIPARQNVPPGIYSDVLTATVLW